MWQQLHKQLQRVGPVLEEHVHGVVGTTCTVAYFDVGFLELLLMFPVLGIKSRCSKIELAMNLIWPLHFEVPSNTSGVLLKSVLNVGRLLFFPPPFLFLIEGFLVATAND